MTRSPNATSPRCSPACAYRSTPDRGYACVPTSTAATDSSPRCSNENRENDNDRADRLLAAAGGPRVAARLARARADARLHRHRLAPGSAHRETPPANAARAPSRQLRAPRVSADRARARLHRVVRVAPLRRAAVLSRDRDADPDRARDRPDARLSAASAVPGADVAARLRARDRHRDLGTRDPLLPRR